MKCEIHLRIGRRRHSLLSASSDLTIVRFKTSFSESAHTITHEEERGCFMNHFEKVSFGVVVVTDKVCRITSFTTEDTKLNTTKLPDKSSLFSHESFVKMTE